jgi:hypothetical protein
MNSLSIDKDNIHFNILFLGAVLPITHHYHPLFYLHSRPNPHLSLKLPLSGVLPECIKGAVNVFYVQSADMGVDFGGAGALVTEKLLDIAQMGSEGMVQEMDTDLFLDLYLLPGSLEHILGGLAGAYMEQTPADHLGMAGNAYDEIAVITSGNRYIQLFTFSSQTLL